MKTLTCFLTLLFLPLACTCVRAQIDTPAYSIINLDSLSEVISTISAPRQRFELVDAYTLEMEEIHWRTWGLGPLLEYRDSLAALVQTPEERLPSEIAAAYYYMNTEYYDYSLAKLKRLEDQLAIYQSVKSHADIYQAFGEMYTEMGLPEEALPYCVLAEKNYQEAGADQAGGYPRGLLDHSKALFALGRPGEAVQKLNKAKELFDLQEDPEGAIWALTNLAIIFGKLRLYDEFDRVVAEEAAYDFPDADLLAMYNANNTGNNRLEAGRYPEAKAAYRRAIRLAEGLDVADYDLMNNYRGMVRSQYYLGAVDSLHYYAGIARDLYDQEERKEGLLAGHFRELSIYVDLASGNFAAAEQAAREIHQEALAKKNDYTIESSLALLALVYEKMGNAPEALRYIRQYLTVRDSVQSANKANALALYRTQFETEEKIREIQRIEGERSLAAARSRQFGIAALVLLALLGLGIFLFLQLRKARRKLQVQNQQLADLNQTKDRFFSIVAHDLRNPITALSRVNEQLERDVANDDKESLAHTTGLVAATTGQLKAMLDNLLNWSLKQGDKLEQQPTDLDIEFLIGESLAVQAPSAHNKGITLVNDCPPEIGLFADEKAVRIVLRNLLSNAIKYTPRGGQVRVSASKVGPKTTLAVSDNGVGMTAQRLAEVFKLNKREDWGTDGEAGTGLGLVLVKELVEANGGRITLDSEVGRGTEARVMWTG